MRSAGYRFFSAAAIAMLLSLLAACGARKNLPQSVRIDGSSTVFPITEAVAEEYQTSQRGKVRVTVGISGTGGGFKKFCRGETDVQDASRPITTSEMEACKKTGVRYYELPIAFDAMAIVVNPKNDWMTSITLAELKRLWEPDAQGKITRWNQVNPSWPDQPIKLYGAGADSGTFDYFTEAVVGKAKASRGDYTASEDDNTLVTGVANDKNALGFVPFSYFEDNSQKMRLVPVDGGEKAPRKGPVAPSRETVENGTYFPLSRPIFIYVNEASAKRREVTEFTRFYLAHGAELVESAKYVPLPKKAYEMAIERVVSGKVGTVFGGHSEVGLKIEDLLNRETKM